ncbi:MAG: T9SS type A sorting domain-containing protein [Bacteroidetes bacterium]|nr:T9SS type A sorting domain-containing protein [Bacteroidota bacterium]
MYSRPFHIVAALVMLCFFTGPIHAQNENAHQQCGTISVANPDFDAEAFEEFKDHFFRSSNQRAVSEIPVQFYIVRTNTGALGYNPTGLTPVLDDVNLFYANADLSFYQCNPVEYIDNSTFYTFSRSEETALLAENTHLDVLNIYIVGSVTTSNGATCGYAYLPPAPLDVIIMNEGCVNNGITLKHELGHYFGLYHPHETEANGIEYVDGSNCGTAGDLLCGTPADPNLGESGMVSSCVYTGNATDPQGDHYDPLVDNVMSYAPSYCRENFTSDQFARVAYHYDEYRDDLDCNYTIGSRDIELTSFTIDNSVTTGGLDISFEAIVKNIGQERITYTSVSVSLSPESNTDSLIEVVSVISSIPLNPGETYTINGVMQLDPNLRGEYFLVGKADHYEQVSESDEANNFKFQQVNLLVPDVDFLLSDLSSDPNPLVIDDWNDISLTAFNPGIVTSYHYVTIMMYLSDDNVLDPFDYTLSDAFYISFLEGGASSTITQNTWLPSTLTAGSKYLICIVDPYDVLEETNESNNQFVFPVEITHGDVDIFFDHFVVLDTSEYAGEHFRVSMSISDAGAQDAPSTTFRSYLSEDEYIDGSDVLLEERQFSTLGYTPSWVIPITTPPGEYHVIVQIDADDIVAETSEANNTASDILHVLTPTLDLTAYSCDFEQSVIGPGYRGAFPFAVHYENESLNQWMDSQVSLHLSDDEFISADDVMVGNYFMDNVRANHFAYIQIDFTIPAGTPHGSRYLIATVDYTEVTAEASEGNNSCAYPVQIGITPEDIAIIDLETTGSADLIEAAVVTLQYSGSGVLFGEDLGLYLADNPDPGAGDQLIATKAIGQLVSGLPSTHIIDFHLPSGLAYSAADYLIARIDEDGSVAETNENNNYSSIALSSIDNLPVNDYIFNWINAPEELTQGISANVNGQIELLGADYGDIGGNSLDRKMGVFLSADDVFDLESDIDLGYAYLPSSSSSNPRDFSFNINPGHRLPSGGYYLLFVLDYLETTVEADEANNISIHPVQLIANPINLRLKELSGPAIDILFPPHQIQFDITVENNGTGSTLATEVEVYMTNDEGETSYGPYSVNVGQLDPGTETTVSWTVNVTYSWRGGDRRFHATIDPDNQLIETNESDNHMETAIAMYDTIVTDYAITNFEINEDDLAMGDIIYATVIVRNSGRNGTHGANLNIYFSEDSVIDQSDVPAAGIIGDVTVSLLEYEEFWVENLTIMVPYLGGTGPYYVISEIVPYEDIGDTNEANDRFALPIQISGPVRDLVADTLLNVPSQIIPLGGFRMKAYYSSVGQEPANFPLNSIYLSSDNILDDDDVLLATSGSYSTQLMTQDYSYYTYIDVTIPHGTPPGISYLIYKVDHNDWTAESNESNNLLALPIEVKDPARDILIDTIRHLPSRAFKWGESLELQYFLSNPGTIDINQDFEIEIFFSSDDLLDESDHLITSTNVLYLLSDYSRGYNLEIEVEYDWPAGPGYIIFVLDAENAVPEDDESNNVYVYNAFEVLPYEKDFTWLHGQLVSQYYGYGITNSGTGLYLTMANLGDGWREGDPNTNVSYSTYYSVDDQLDDSDVAETNASGITDLLDEGVIKHYSTRIRIPDGFPTGPFYMISILDRFDQFPETDETNNLILLNGVITEQEMPDFAIRDAQIQQASSGAGSQVDARATVHNVGTATGHPSISGFLSADRILDTDQDSQIGFISIGTLNPHVYDDGGGTFTIPTGTVPGDYYIIIMCDASNSVGEFNENNNQVVIPFHVEASTADLLISSEQLSSIDFVHRRSYEFNYTILNSGNANLGSTLTRGFLSDDDVLDESDYQLDYAPEGGLDIGESNSSRLYFDIEEIHTPGSKFFIARIDDNDSYYEIDELNNYHVTPVEVIDPQVNLEAYEATSLVNSIEAGGEITIRTEVRNTGSYQAEGLRIHYWLSNDDALVEGEDLYLGGRYDDDAILTPNSAYVYFHNDDIPEDTEPGYYFIFFKVILSGIDSETDLSDNILMTQQIEILPLVKDLEITSAVLSDNTVDPDQSVNIAYTVTNVSPWSWIGSNYISVYYSSDNVYGSEDKYLGRDRVSSTDPSEVETGTVYFGIPDDINGGQHYLMLVLDSYNDQDETNEDNNVMALGITVSGPTAVQDGVLNAVEITPNPSSGPFNIHVENQNDDLLYKVFNVEGQLIQDGTISRSTADHSIVLDQGIYFMHMYHGEHETVRKLVVQ